MATPRIHFTLGSHVRFLSLDFLCTGVDYGLVLLPPFIDIDAISEALSNLRQCTDEGQALESDWPGSSQGRSMQASKPHDHGKACGQSSTTVHLNPSAGEIPADLPTHHAQLSRKSSRLPRELLAPAPTKTIAVGQAPTSLGSMTRGLYIISSASATTSSMAVTPTTVATSSHGHDVRRQRLRTASTCHDR
jgi:hypothetical protein